MSDTGDSPIQTIVCAGLPPAWRSSVRLALPQAHLLNTAIDTDPVFHFSRRLGNAVLIVSLRSLLEKTESLQRLRALPSLHLLAINATCTPELCRSALLAGASGLIPISDVPSQLHRALETVAQGELWCPRKILAQLIREWAFFSGRKEEGKLTAREREILVLLGQGHSNQVIADTLFISRETVRWHLRALYSKIGVSDRLAAQQYYWGNTQKDYLLVRRVG